MNEILMLAGANQDAFGHYCRLEERREGAGAMFDSALHEALNLLANHPFLGPECTASAVTMRNTMLANHPFLGPECTGLAPMRRRVILEWDVAVYYSVEGHRNVVHAILHLRQDPAAIRAILRSRLPQ